jgi:hypothetical protein
MEARGEEKRVSGVGEKTQDPSAAVGMTEFLGDSGLAMAAETAEFVWESRSLHCAVLFASLLGRLRSR